MPYSNRFLKLASLLLLSCLFTTSILPSFAADKTALLTPQQLADVYGLASDEISESEPISRADFLRSADSFFSQTSRTFYSDYFGFEDNIAMHNVAIIYLDTQLNSLQTEVDQLIAETPQGSRRAKPKPAQSIRRTGHLLRTHSKESCSKTYPLRAKQLTPDTPVEDYELALEQLSTFSIDLRQPDGSFKPDQLLTQGDYLRHLRQLDIVLIELAYGSSSDVESIVDVDVAQSNGASATSAANDRLTSVLNGIAQVKALMYRLQDLAGNHSVRKPLKSDWKGVEGNPSSKALQLAQTDSATNEVALVTQGEFALYMAEQLSQLPDTGVPFIFRIEVESHALSYYSLEGHLAVMIETLENAITQLN